MLSDGYRRPAEDARRRPAIAAVTVGLRNFRESGDGGQTRDFVYVKDVVAALAHVAERGDLHGVFNVGYGNSMTINDLADQIVSATRSSSRIIHLAERAGDVRHSRASVDKLLATGYRHVSSLERGLEDTVADMVASE